MNGRFTHQCNVMFYVYADLCSLLAATSQCSTLIGQSMQANACHNGNEMRNATYATTQISNQWPYCSLPMLCQSHVITHKYELSLSLLLQIAQNTCFIRTFRMPDNALPLVQRKAYIVLLSCFSGNKYH